MKALGNFWNSNPRAKVIVFGTVCVVILGVCCTISSALRTAPINILIVMLQFLAKFGNKDSTSVALSVVTATAAGFLGMLLWAIFNWLFRILFPHSTKRSDFPFRPIETRSILEEITSFPEIETSYISHEDPEEATRLESLAEHRCILLVGRMGIGKTREAAELITRMDIPLSQALVLQPKSTFLGTSFEWPTNVPLRQRRIVLLLDNLNDFELYDEDSDQTFQLAGDSLGFERVLSRLINEFCRRCDDFRVIATLRLESEEWRTIENRADHEPWNKFHIHSLVPHTSKEAVDYIGLSVARLNYVQLTPEAIEYLADYFDGTFEGLRDFLRLQETSARSNGAKVITRDDAIAGFAGTWETRFYKTTIEPHDTGRAIFEALNIIAKAHITPHEDIVMGLAARIVGKQFAWFRERQCRQAFRDLRLNVWISKRDAILKPLSDVYIEGRGSLEKNLDSLADVLLRLSKRRTLSPQLNDSLLIFAQLMNTSYGRHDLGIQLSKRVAEIEPNNTRAWITLGIAHSKLAQDAEALKARQRVVQLLPNNSFAWCFLASSWYELENYDESQSALEIAAKIDPRLTSIAYLQGKIALKLDHVEQAMEAFERATKLNPSLAHAWSGLAQGCLQMKQFREAIRYFHRAIDMGIEDPITWSGLGIALKKLERYSVARKAFRCAIDLDPSHPLPWSHLGEVLLEQLRCDEAVEAYQEAIKRDNKNPVTWGGLGKALNRLGRYKEAIKPHQQALELGGHRCSNQLGLGIAFYGDGKLEKAAEAFRECAYSHTAMGYLVKIRDQLMALGKEHIAKKIDIDTKRAETNEANRLVEAGNTEAAQELCDSLFSTSTEDWVVWSGLCSAYRKMGRFDLAIESGARATRIEPKAYSAWYVLGRAYEAAGNFPAAETAFEKTLTMNPSHGKAHSALERVQLLAGIRP